MRLNKTTLLFSLFAALTVSGCKSIKPVTLLDAKKAVEIPVVPVSTSHVLPAGSIDADAASRVGVTTLPVPGPVEFAPIAQANFLQAFINMGLDASLTDNGFIVHLPSDSHFDLDNATIKPQMISRLQQIVNEANKPYLAGYQIQVTGHTDSIGSDSHNQRLSERRASNVLNKMVALGSDRNKLSSIGLGDSTPKYFGELDRRTDFVFRNR